LGTVSVVWGCGCGRKLRYLKPMCTLFRQLIKRPNSVDFDLFTRLFLFEDCQFDQKKIPDKTQMYRNTLKPSFIFDVWNICITQNQISAQFSC
jgi:hypothetical protein